MKNKRRYDEVVETCNGIKEDNSSKLHREVECSNMERRTVR